MRAILDTHAFLWFVAGDDRLSTNARAFIEGEENRLTLSVASLWEMAIKVSLRKLVLSRPFGEFIRIQLDANGFDLIGIELAHLVVLADLAFHHRDPFDRLIVAQCLSEDLPLVSGDGALDAYGLRRLW